MPSSEKTYCFISACLLGVGCRYDGGHRALDSVILNRLMKKYLLLPICPEQLGGFPTPRPPAQFVGGTGEELLRGEAKIVDETGSEVTERYMRSVEETLKLANIFGVTMAILKEKSPACGVHLVYRDGRTVHGEGVVTAALRDRGIVVISEVDL